MGPFGVEPHHPFGGGDFDLVDVAPGALPADEFVLERPDGGLVQRVVQRVTGRADRGIDAFVEEPLVERDGGVLPARIAMTDQPADAGCGVSLIGA